MSLALTGFEEICCFELSIKIQNMVKNCFNMLFFNVVPQGIKKKNVFLKWHHGFFLLLSQKKIVFYRSEKYFDFRLNFSTEFLYCSCSLVENIIRMSMQYLPYNSFFQLQLTVVFFVLVKRNNRTDA